MAADRSRPDVEGERASPGDEGAGGRDDASGERARQTLATAAAAHVPPEGRRGPVALPERYEALRLLGSGGFGEVYRVFDRKLERVVALKVLRSDVEASPAQRARFLAEIQLAAGLSHPGIVAVHDYGELLDGGLWFTMPEVTGRTLRAAIDEVFSAPPAERASGRRRLLDIFARVCDAVAYAHVQGVVHRDLKPENVMLGAFGEVFVVDWGLARRVRRVRDAPWAAGAARPAEPSLLPALTRDGDVLGTPAYMAPEQARGEVDKHGPMVDVYALGAMLYYILVGRPPPPWRPGAPRIAPGGPLGDEELASLCAQAMAPDPADRPPNASALSRAIGDCLAGTARRERALVELQKAARLTPEILVLGGRAEALRREAKGLLSSVRPFDDIQVKLPGWEREDEAARLEREATLLETRWIEGAYGALAIEPDLAEAHAALADHFHDQLLEAERARRDDDAARSEILLAKHDRGQYASILRGLGAVSLVTDPPGAEVFLERYVLRQRRLVPEPARELGRTPIVEAPIEKGSYRLRIVAPGRRPVIYPVLVERGTHWHGCPPESTEPYPIVLPAEGELGPDEIYVPAGYAWTGGDAEAPDSLPQRFLWIDGFVVMRFPVTNEAYLAFLNDLVAQGREAEALAACPRAFRGTVFHADELAYERSAGGVFSLKGPATAGPSAFSSRPRTPAVLMSWLGAVAYGRWLAARAGKPFRLLHELEREKATRGVDGRCFPWGDHFDPTFACTLSSHRGEALPVGVEEYPSDESPYGMRGGAGNARDACMNLWTLEGPIVTDGRVVLGETPLEGNEWRAVRGGAWSSVENRSRAAARFVTWPDQGASAIGLRVGRSFG